MTELAKWLAPRCPDGPVSPAELRWSGYLTAENAAAVRTRMQWIFGGRELLMVAAYEHADWRPEFRGPGQLDAEGFTASVKDGYAYVQWGFGSWHYMLQSRLETQPSSSELPSLTEREPRLVFGADELVVRCMAPDGGRYWLAVKVVADAREEEANDGR